MRRYLSAARLFGATALTIVAIFGVAMSDGYLGGRDHPTSFAQIYAAALGTLTLVCIAGLVRAARRASAPTWADALVPIIWAANIGVFVPAIVFDPMLVVLLLAWHLMLLVQHIFPALTLTQDTRYGWAPGDEEADIESWDRRYGGAARHLLLVAVVVTVAVVGFEAADSLLVLLLCTLVHGVALGATARFTLFLYAESRKQVLALWLLLAASLLAVGFARFELALTMLAVYQVCVLASLAQRTRLFAELIQVFFDHPALLVVGTFAVLILCGALFLTFPRASTGAPVGLLDAVFMATSASTVTGLIVLDTATDFTLFGHVVLIVLIQVGGLSIMVLSTFATLMLGAKLGLRGASALGAVLNLKNPAEAFRLTRFIVVSALIIEALGAVLLTFSFLRRGMSPGEAMWHGAFHAISAFNNAGFALQTDSLMSFQQEPFALMVIAGLITCGSFGFPVLAGGWQVVAHWVRVARKQAPRRRIRLTVQSRIAILATALLLVGGALLYLLLEWNHTLAGLSVSDRVFNAIFQSATIRTAGFVSVDMGKLHTASILMMSAIMFIGASPGGTGGGIKTTTAAVLLGAMRSAIQGRAQVTLFDRQIPHDIVLRSIAIAMTSAGIMSAAIFALLLTETAPLQALLFEVASAMATVGISVGITPMLSPAGRVILIFVMFAGRVGPLTLALLFGGKAERGIEYPSERIMVG